MNLKQFLLRPAARIAGFNAHRQMRQFIRAHDNSRDVQDQLLRRLCRLGAETRFGRDHGLASVRTYEDFTRAIPVNTYETLAPYLRDVYAGDTSALFPHGTKVLLFALTSGTTGEPKRIPITAEALAHYRRGWNVFGFKLLDDHPEAWLRPILQVTSPAVEQFSPAGVPCGSISGLLAATQKKIVRRMYVADGEVMAIDDPIAKYYTLMRLAMPRDVALISTANPSTIIKLMTVARSHVDSLCRDLHDGTLSPPAPLPARLAERLRRLPKRPALARRIEAGVDRDGELLMSHFWGDLVLAHWTGGTLGLYLPEVRRLSGNATIRDIGLLASEGRFSLPMQDNTSAGVADILAAFLEFIPADQVDADTPTVLRSHELDIGAEYFLVITNFSGLWRYNIFDRIRVTGRLGQSPVFKFLSKGAHTTSLTGEKLTEHQVVAAMGRVCRQLGQPIDRFLAQPCFDTPPYYLLTVECNGLDTDRLAASMDEALGELNIEYADKRRTGRLGPLRLHRPPPGTLDGREQEILTARSGRAEQYKHQYLLTDVRMPADT